MSKQSKRVQRRRIKLEVVVNILTWPDYDGKHLASDIAELFKGGMVTSAGYDINIKRPSLAAVNRALKELPDAD